MFGRKYKRTNPSVSPNTQPMNSAQYVKQILIKKVQSPIFKSNYTYISTFIGHWFCSFFLDHHSLQVAMMKENGTKHKMSITETALTLPIPGESSLSLAYNLIEQKYDNQHPFPAKVYNHLKMTKTLL